MSVNDVRRLEDLPPVADGDQFRVPLANIDLAQTSVIEDEKRVKMAQMLIQVGFSPEETLTALNLPEIPHTGVPSTQLQPVSMIDPADPSAVY
jgi:hypothetical protein